MQNSFCEHLIEAGELEDNNDDNNDDNFFATDDEYIDNQSNVVYIFNIILSGTARLNVLLPAATILAFTLLYPLITSDGHCTSLNRWLMGFFLAISAASCVFFSITDSFRTVTGRLYYGVATANGIWAFCGGHVKPCVPSDYRLRWGDLFHSSLSLLAFLTFAASHSDVLYCYNVNLPRKVTNSVPLVVGFVISVLFVMLPSRRKGIGYPFLLQNDAFYCTK